MSIHSISDKTSNILSPSKPKQTEKANDAVVTSDEQNNDRVDITSVANKIAQALESSSSTPAIDEARVNRVKDALERGDYPIDAQKIAQKMMQMEQEQLNSR